MSAAERLRCGDVAGRAAPVWLLRQRDVFRVEVLLDALNTALPAEAEAAEADLLARTTPGLEAFASLVESHRSS